jgi:hypothetical protein
MNVTQPARTRTPVQRRAALDRALTKSVEQVAVNNLPRVLRVNPTERVWAIGSRTEGGVIWLVTESPEGELRCDCPAESSACWHLTHVARALSGAIGYHAAPARPRLIVDAATLSGKR